MYILNKKNSSIIYVCQKHLSSSGDKEDIDDLLIWNLEVDDGVIFGDEDHLDRFLINCVPSYSFPAHLKTCKIIIFFKGDFDSVDGSRLKTGRIGS